MQQIRDYLFNDLRTNNIHVTPAHIAEEMVNTLPAELWNDPELPNKKFLDICCKSGIFLIKLRDKLMTAPAMVKAIPDEKERRKHILKYMLYGIAPCNLCEDISRIELYGKIYTKGNIVTITDNYKAYISKFKIIRNQKTRQFQIDKTLKAVKSIIDTKFVKAGGNEEVTFDVVIGNPPYNDDIYLDFVQLGHNIAKECSSWVTPAKFQAKDDAKNQNFCKEIVPHISEIVYYPDCLDIFAIQDAGGIAYYLVDNNKYSICKITNISAMKPIINSVEHRNLTNDQTLWNCGNTIVEKIRNSEGFKPYIFEEVTTKKAYTVNVNKQLNVATGTSGCYDWKNGCINQSWIGKGGVIFAEQGTNIIPAPKLITANKDNSSGTSINIFTSNNKNEIDSFCSWINTKLIRFLIMINIGSLTMMNERGWRFVPDPGSFNHTFTDEELYTRYGITPEEIKIINSLIKERETINVMTSSDAVAALVSKQATEYLNSVDSAYDF